MTLPRWKRWRHAAILGVGALSLALAAAGCGGGGQAQGNSTAPASKAAGSSASTATQATEHLTVLELTPTPSPTLWFFSLAQALGAFKKYGLDVTIRHSSGGGPEKIQALLGGQADVVTSDIIAFLSAVNQGSKLNVIFVPTPNYAQSLLAEKSITAPSQLNGKALAVPSLGGAARFLAMEVLQHYGVDTNSIHWTVSPGTLGRLTLVETGHAQGDLEPPDQVALIQGGKYPNIHVLVPSTVEATGPFPNFVFVTTPAIEQSHAEALNRLTEAMLYTMRTFEQDPSAYAKAALEVAGKPYTLEELTNVGKTLAQDQEWGVNGGINLASIDKVEKLFFSVTKQPNHLPPTNQLVDTQFLTNALKKLGMATVGHDVPDWEKASS